MIELLKYSKPNFLDKNILFNEPFNFAATATKIPCIYN
jgi:hypothetical protein